MTRRTGIGRRGWLRGRVATVRLGAVLVVTAIALAAIGVSRAAADGTVTKLTGTFNDGATYLIEVPAGWNGTLLLYSHGYVVPGSPNPAVDVGDSLTRGWLLDNGCLLYTSDAADE